MSGERQIVLKENDGNHEKICFLCGHRLLNDGPVALFLDGTNLAVCGKCTEEHAPNVLAAIKHFWKKYRYLAALEAVGWKE